MKTLFALFAAAVLAAPAVAQEPPKPGPEHDVLKKMAGDWTMTMKTMGQEYKGTSTYKMEVGGLWLTSSMEMDMGGMKFTGKGLDSYDPTKKKYNGVWVDNMMTSPVIFEGTYDKEKKVLTMEGSGPGPDGKPMKYKSATTMPDDDTIVFDMQMGDGKDMTFTITYKRKK